MKENGVLDMKGIKGRVSSAVGVGVGVGGGVL